MKIFEVIAESSTTDEIIHSIEELVVRYKARDLTKISTPMLLSKLHAMNYSIEMESLLDILRTISSVGASNDKIVTLDTAIPQSSKDPEDDTVSKLASKQMKKDIK